jgi:hypothetical protein
MSLGSSGVSELVGLTNWLHNPEAKGLFLEFVTVYYFTAEPSLQGGYSYTCWVENVNNAMVPQLYYTVANTFADMTIPPNSPVSQGSAEVYTQSPIQVVNWNPFSEGVTTQNLTLTRANTVTYKRRLFIPSNSVRLVAKDFRSVRTNRTGLPTDMVMGGTLFFHWAH